MKRTLALLSSALLLAACGQTTPLPPQSTGTVDGRPVPVATAQMLALQMQLGHGLNAQGINPDMLGVSSEEVSDLDGRPLYHLTLLGPNVNDFWETIKHPTPGASYQIYATGAVDKRDFYSFILNESWFESVQKTLLTAGSFKRFVSPTGGRLYLEDKTGRIWNTDSAEEVPESTLQQQRQAFEVMLTTRQSDGTFDGLQAAWAKYTADANTAALIPQSTGGVTFPTLKALTLPNGNIDVKALVDALKKTNGGLNALATSTKYPGELANCEGWFCAGMRYSGAVRKNPGVPYNENDPEASGLGADFREGDFGNQQWLESQWNRYAPWGGVWAEPDAITSAVIPTSIIGCGPTAIMRLFNWYAIQRSSYTRSGNLNLASDRLPVSTPKELVTAMTQPVNIGVLNNSVAYAPEIDTFLNSKFLVNGVFTRDTDITPGVNNWIQNRAPAANRNIHMYGNSFAFVNVGGLTIYSNPVGAIAFSQYTWQMRDLLRDKIGHDNEPVVVMSGYNANNDVTGHIYMSQAYIVHEGLFSANVLVYLTRTKGDGREGSFVNITDAGGTYGGAWGLDDHPTPILPDAAAPTPAPPPIDPPERDR